MISAVVLLSQHCDSTDIASRFEEFGFTAMSVAPNAMLVSAEASHFRDVFQTELEQSEKEGVHFLIDDQKTRSLPIDKVPKTLQKCISSIEFEEPIHFGPPDY